jgi:hypothetical protein
MTDVEYLCCGLGGRTGPIDMSRHLYGIRVRLTPSCSWALTQWLSKQGEEIHDLHDYILDGEKLCNFLEFWLYQDQKINGVKTCISFKGVIGVTDLVVTFRKGQSYEEIVISFTHTWYNIIGRIIDRKWKRK